MSATGAVARQAPGAAPDGGPGAPVVGAGTTARNGSRGRATRLTVRVIGLTYLALLLAIPVGLIFWRTFAGGLAPVVAVLKAPEFQHALWLTAAVTVIAVPINTVFGVITALALVRRRFPGRRLLNAAIDLPFALSPVVIGLSLLLVYGENGWFGPALHSAGFQVIFAVPGMVLATVFVSLPFVAREVIPVLQEIGTDQEEAAYTLGASQQRTFWRVTLPAIRWGVIYGVVLTTARALGEFGAVSVVSGRISGKTETLTLYVESRYNEFDLIGAYTAAVVLALMAMAVLLAMTMLQSGRGADILHRVVTLNPFRNRGEDERSEPVVAPLTKEG
jgi:sulfate/thiosulfate transport system permease protein